MKYQISRTDQSSTILQKDYVSAEISCSKGICSNSHFLAFQVPDFEAGFVLTLYQIQLSHEVRLNEDIYIDVELSTGRSSYLNLKNGIALFSLVLSIILTLYSVNRHILTFSRRPSIIEKERFLLSVLALFTIIQSLPSCTQFIIESDVITYASWIIRWVYLWYILFYWLQIKDFALKDASGERFKAKNILNIFIPLVIANSL